MFPEDINIPLQTLERLWGRTGGLDDLDTENAERSPESAVAHAGVRSDAAIRPVARRDSTQYLIHRLGDRLVALQCELLDAHRPGTQRVGRSATQEPYLWDHLAYHLNAAGRSAELVASVLDLRYLVARLCRETHSRPSGISSPRNKPVPATRRWASCAAASSNQSHIFNRCETRADLEATLHSRLQHVDRPRAARRARSPHRCPRHMFGPSAPLPDLPHPALIRTLTGEPPGSGAAP